MPTPQAKKPADEWPAHVNEIKLTILGQPVSLKNNYKITYIRPRNKPKGFYKLGLNKSAGSYLASIEEQVPERVPLLQGRLMITLHLYYAWEGPDLSEDLLLDALQGLIYKNDRQVRTKHVYHHIDKANPRAEMTIEPYQQELF